MEPLKCRSCGKELTVDMEVEYSQWLTEYFCHPDHAMDYYFNEMQSTPFDAEDRIDELEDRGLKLVNGKLYYKN